MGVQYLDKELPAEEPQAAPTSDESNFKTIAYLDPNKKFAEDIDNEFEEIYVSDP